MRERILIVEDEALIARAVAYALRCEGFDVEIASDGANGLAAARACPPDLVILDIVLPGGISGSDVCREIRAESIVPIIILSARDSETDRVLGLERGADDYVPKPFSMPELIARTRAQLRRRNLDRATVADSVRDVGDLAIDTLQREVTVGGERVQLTPSEFELLAFLSERPGRVTTRQEIVSRLWSSDFVGDTRACDAHIRRLRAKIEADATQPRRLLSVRGVGYKLVAPD